MLWTPCDRRISFGDREAPERAEIDFTQIDFSLARNRKFGSHIVGNLKIGAPVCKADRLRGRPVEFRNRIREN